MYRLLTENTIEEKIIERAELKLRLDAVVVQQGRLPDQKRALSKEEMSNMVQFGANEIFRAKGSMITDEDIDLILSKGVYISLLSLSQLNTHTHTHTHTSQVRNEPQRFKKRWTNVLLK